MKFIRKNITFILGISIPIAMILLIAASIYIPGLLIQPKFNFLYTIDDNYPYNGQQMYSVVNSKLINNEIELSGIRDYNPPRNKSKLFVYGVTNNIGQEVSFEQALKLNLDPNLKSPDGFEIVNGSQGGGGFPFFFYPGTDYNTKYLKGHNVSKKINVQSSELNYFTFRFVGWIK